MMFGCKYDSWVVKKNVKSPSTDRQKESVSKGRSEKIELLHI